MFARCSRKIGSERNGWMLPLRFGDLGPATYCQKSDFADDSQGLQSRRHSPKDQHRHLVAASGGGRTVRPRTQIAASLCTLVMVEVVAVFAVVREEVDLWHNHMKRSWAVER